MHCSICNRSENDVSRLISGPGANVCGECVEACTNNLNNPDYVGAVKTGDSCTFCSNPRSEVDKLVTMSDVMLCNECIAACNALLKQGESKSNEKGGSSKTTKSIETVIQEADQYFEKGSLEDAELHYLLAMVVLERQYPEHHPQVLECMEKLGDTFIAEGKWHDALPVYRRVVDIRRKNDSRTATALIQFATCLEHLSQLEEARKHYSEAVGICEEHMEKEHLVGVLLSYAKWLRRMEFIGEAVVTEQKAKKIQKG